ncbi:MAG: hypothetical protein ACI8XM_001234 [Haloarculaceae archaeon]|jgi:hypothetical protein
MACTFLFPNVFGRIVNGSDLPAAVWDTLHEHGLRGYNEVHAVGIDDPAFAGELDRGDRYRFVDVRERGQLQSYVVD